MFEMALLAINPAGEATFEARSFNFLTAFSCMEGDPCRCARSSAHTWVTCCEQRLTMKPQTWWRAGVVGAGSTFGHWKDHVTDKQWEGFPYAVASDAFMWPVLVSIGSPMPWQVTPPCGLYWYQ